MSDIDRIKLRTMLVSCCVTIAVLTILGAATAFAVCIPTVYNVTSSAPPPIGNWTDTSGAVWSPSGGFPGCAPGDTASDNNASPTTLIINSAIPNPIIGLNLSCPGCVIDIQSGGSLTLSGSGTISNSSTIIVEPGGTLTIANGSSLNVNTGTSLSVNGGLVDIQSGGSVTLTGASTVTNGGVLNVDGGTLTIPGGSLFTVQSNGQLEFTTGSVNGGGTINNHGTIQMAGSGLVTVSPVVNNSAPGTVTVSSGTLSLAGGGNGNAPFVINSGGTLDFPSGSYTMTPNGSVSGNGTLSVTGGTLSMGGVTSPGAFVLTAGTVTGGGFLSIVNSMTWSGGTLTGSGGTELAGTGSGTIDGANGASAPMVLDGRSFNNYGNINFTATAAHPLQLSNGANFTTYGLFSFGGDGSITGSSPSSFNVSPNGVVGKTGGSSTSTINPPFTNSSANAFASSGTLEFAGNTTSNGGIFFAASGATLKFSAPTTTFDGSSQTFGDVGTTLVFSAGSAQISGEYIVDGSTDICGATVDITSGQTSNFKFTSGKLTVESDFTVTGSGTWSGGTMFSTNANAFFGVASGAAMTIDAATGFPTDDFLLFANDGTVTYNATVASGNYLKFMNDALVDNTGLFDIQTDVQIFSGSGVSVSSVTKAASAPDARTRAARMARLTAAAAKRGRPHVSACVCSSSNEVDNSGTLQKSAGTGTTSFGPILDNSNAVNALTGTLSFLDTYTQTAGTTTLGGGNIQLSSPMALNGGTLNGAGLITGSVASAGGEVAPGTASTTGVINVNGDYTETSTSKLTIKIAGPSAGQFDQLNVTGNANPLAGTFTGTFIGGYSPATGTTVWSVLTYASHTGAFETVNPPTYARGTVTSAYSPTSFDLTAVTPAAADLKLLMNGPATINAAAPLSYTINVSNLGPDPANGVITVADTLPAGATAASGSGTGWSCGAPSGGVITCTTPGPLASGNSLPVLTISMTAPVASGNVTNSATVSNPVSDPVASNNTASVTTNVGPQANLAITKVNAGPTPVNPGQNFSYTIVVTNNGPSTATAPVVTDNTPVGIAFVSVSGGGCTAFPCTLASLTAGQSVTLTSTYSIPNSYSGGAISNTASVSSSVNDPNIADNSATATTPVGAAADVGITKTTSQSSVNLGQNITYTITVSNFGPAGATGVVVTDPTPPGLTVVSVSGGGCTSFPCTIGALAVGPPVTITAVYNVPANYSGTSVTNTATVSSANDPNASNNSASATSTISAQADLSINKTGPPSATAGQNITYTISVTNSGQLSAANTFVNDSTPAGLTFVSNSGACSGPFPCALGTLGTGQTVVITSTFSIPANYANPTITNTATVSTSSPESNTANNSASATTPISTSATADLSVAKSGPGAGSAGSLVEFTVIVQNNGPSTANNVVVVDPTPAGLTFVSNTGACTTPYPCNIGSLTPNTFTGITSRYMVVAQAGSVTNTASASSSATDSVPGNNSASVTMLVTPAQTCPHPPVLTSPTLGATVTSPVTLSWIAVSGASSYNVTVTGPNSTQTFTAAAGSITVSLPNGAYSWNVQAIGTSNCPPANSATSTFSVCNPAGVPVPSVVSLTTTGQTYTVQWTPIDGVTSYELQESTDAAFSAPTSTTLPGSQQTFTKNVTTATAFYYRVRVVGTCSQTIGAFSVTVPVIVIPLPALGSLNPNIPIPAGSTQPVTFQIHVNGLPNVTTSFVATVDKPWLAVTPASGLMPPEGVTFTISADPSTLQDGTWTGTVIIVFGTSGVSGKQALDVAPKTSIPVSISLTTPVTPASLTGPSATAVVIPSVGHLAGLGSEWQSDIRIANTTALPKNVQLTFSGGSATSSAVKQTTLNIAPGATTALDDMVNNWFGVGAMGDSSNGVLTVQPLDASGKPDLSVTTATATVASSRTYNTSAAGTLGQFIPAVPLASFISKAPGANSILSLQQIAQSDTYRTNLGLVEVTGNPASLLVSVFNAAGSKILDLPISLAAGEQRQLNSFLANQGITLTNGHIEVQATGGIGKVTAYASVIDDQSTAPLLVSGVPIGGTGATRFVIPGVASLDTGASWRSDVRIFNASASPQTATMTLYPTGNPSASVVQNVTIQPGEVKALDDIVHATFNLTNAGGALHVTTAAATPLVVTARTYDVTPGGTLGQFIQAVTPTDAVGNGDRSLQLIQMEDSPRYRTNLGLAEVTGKPATAEVTVILPDSKVAPKVQIPLAAFEYRQFSIISSLGLGNTYNARISVRVIDGQGKITAYGSVVDQKTQDPTYVPAQ